MNIFFSIFAICIGVLTAITACKALVNNSSFGRSSIPIGIIAGFLATMGFLNLRKTPGILIPWTALGIVLFIIFVLKFLSLFAHHFFKGLEPDFNRKASPVSKPSKVRTHRKKDAYYPPIGALLSNPALEGAVLPEAESDR